MLKMFVRKESLFRGLTLIMQFYIQEIFPVCDQAVYEKYSSFLRYVLELLTELLFTCSYQPPRKDKGKQELN